LVEAAVAHACTEIGEIFKPRANSLGLSEAVTATLSELRYVGATVEGLRELAVTLEQPLRARITELAAILENSDGTLRLLGREHLSDQMRRVVDSSSERLPEFEAPGRIFVFAVQELSPLQGRWLKWLAAAGTEVVVLVETQQVPPASAVADSSPEDPLAASVRPAALYEAPLRVLELPWPKIDEASMPPSDRMSQRLFRGEFALSLASPTLEVVATADRLSECEWALRGCAEALQAGANTADLAIAFRDEAYGPLLLSASRRLGVPVRLSTRAPLLSNRLVAFILGLMRAFVSNDVRNLIAPLESAYAELDVDVVRRVKILLRTAYLEEDSWREVERWAAQSPWAPAWLEPALDWRREALALPQVNVAEEPMLFDADELVPEPQEEAEIVQAQESVSGHEWLQRIRTLVEILPVLDADEHDSTSWDNRAQKVMIQTLADEASVDKVRKRPPLKFEEAVDWCEKVWKQADCSVPAAAEGVQVVASALALPSIQKLWVLGLSDGRFPKRASADPVLPDWERLELRAAGLGLLTSAEAHHGREREEFVRLCGAPSSALVLSYPLALDDRDAGPSSFVAEARRVAGDVKERIEKGVVPEVRRCYLPSDVALREALDRPTVYPLEVEVSPPVAEKLSKGPLPKMSFRELTDASNCPFLYQARRLKVLSEGASAFANALPGLAARANLPNIPDVDRARQALHLALGELLERMRGQAEPWELKLHALQGKKYIEGLLDREFRARQLWPRTIDPKGEPRFKLIQKVEGGELLIQDRAVAVGEIEGRKSYHLYRRAALRTAQDSGLIETLLADLVCGDGGAGVVEVDSFSMREVFGSPPLKGNEQGLKSFRFLSDTKVEVDQSLNRAARVAVSGEMAPTPSEQSCKFCEFGELCRRSRVFSEPTSPFGSDRPLDTSYSEGVDGD
jgi:hypothetical protein